MLGEKAQVGPKLLSVHLLPSLRRRCAAHVDELRFRPEHDRPTGGRRAVAEIYFFVEHEEVRVERADLGDGLSAREEHRADEELSDATRAVVEPAGIEGVQRPAARSEPTEKEVLRGETPGCGEAADGGLQRHVRIEKSRADNRGAGLALRKLAQAFHRVGERPRIRVHQKEVIGRRERDAHVERGAVTRVGVELDQTNVREGPANELSRAVRGPRVDDDHLVRVSECGQTSLQVGARVV